MLTPSFFVRDIPIYGDVILSPMAGFSDVPYRAICRAFGSAMQYTEFVPVEMLLGRPNPLWRVLDKQPGESPLVFQIFGNDAEIILKAAQKIESWGPHIIDINMGCSTRRVSGRGAGVGMMPQPELVARTFHLLSTHLTIPVSGKIRLGWNELKNYREIAHIMADNGAALIAIHGRTKEQKYDGLADWDAIAELKQAVTLPVIGNGDVITPADIDRMKAHTGCDAVMIGRAAIGNPWLFARRERANLTPQEFMNTIHQHWQEMVAYYGDKESLLLFRKHIKRYLEGLPLLQALTEQLLRANTAAMFELLLAEVGNQLHAAAVTTIGPLLSIIPQAKGEPVMD
ncbi:MAG: tRNA-dihydrouridine synthase family protein [Chloroflexi bacterium]|nr:tRNA-dihydrouridine synthase family protein [Chloroflexota bacterium]MBP8056493.1 tRNA-dihydrouridine synthase family protein [Chloroflexota bacterium]